MTFQELYFTFPQPLTAEQENIFIGYVLAVRDAHILAKLPNLRAAAALQAKIPMNPAKPVLEGLVMQCDMIRDNINQFFVLEPVEGAVGKYRLKLSESMNMAGRNKVGQILTAMARKEWIVPMIKEMKVQDVKVGGVP
jgi:hypothetical protein